MVYFITRKATWSTVKEHCPWNAFLSSIEGEGTEYQSAHCTKCSGMTGISEKFMESLIGKLVPDQI